MEQTDLNRGEVLGRGVAFPLRLENGQVGLNEYDSQVQQSIRLILGTGRGERAMRPDFGGNLYRLAFEPLAAATLTLVQQQVRETLAEFEPRIEVLEVTTEQQADAGLLLVVIAYRVRRTGAIQNMVYPFYLEGGEP